MNLIIAIPTTGNLPFEFVNCFLNLIVTLPKHNINFLISMNQGSFLPHLRAKILDADISRGKNQIPFEGHDFDYILMLDSDILFSPEQVLRLINHQRDFVSGYYVYAGEQTKPESDRYIVAGLWDEDFFKKNKYFASFKVSDIEGKEDLIKADWLGLGFCLIKRDIFKKIEYPWFASETITIGKMIDTTSEDVGFCRKLTKAGIELLIDPKVRVGHLKSIAL